MELKTQKTIKNLKDTAEKTDNPEIKKEISAKIAALSDKKEILK